VAPLAVVLAPDLALVHHPIGGDELHFTPPRLILEINVSKLLAAVIADNEAGGL
jgi:hypothetical protein